MEALCTKITEVNLSVFVYIQSFIKISLQSAEQI